MGPAHRASGSTKGRRERACSPVRRVGRVVNGVGATAQVVIFFGVVAFTIYKCGPKRRSKKKKRG